MKTIVNVLPPAPKPVIPIGFSRWNSSRPRPERRPVKQAENKESPEQLAMLRWLDLNG